MFTQAIIDGDVLPYSCGFAAEGEPVSHSLRLVKNKMNQILEDVGTDNYRLFISGEGNYREDVDLAYKATRTARKPEHFNEIRKYMVERWNAEKCDGFEADDIVGALMCEGESKGVVGVSPDKDLKTVPGHLYNPVKRTHLHINELQADRFLGYQLLAGDRTDNIPGLPLVGLQTRLKYELRKTKGCGDTTAKNIIKHGKGLPWNDVLFAYADWGMEASLTSEEIFDYFIVQLDLLYIGRSMYDGRPQRREDAGYPVFDLVDVETAMADVLAHKGMEEKV
jgi:5'-3' exonuclease